MHRNGTGAVLGAGPNLGRPPVGPQPFDWVDGNRPMRRRLRQHTRTKGSFCISSLPSISPAAHALLSPPLAGRPRRPSSPLVAGRPSRRSQPSPAVLVAGFTHATDASCGLQLLCATVAAPVVTAAARRRARRCIFFLAGL